MIRVEDVFQVTGRGSALAGCFKRTMDDKRLGRLKDADLVITDIAGNEIEMKLMGFEIMRNHYIGLSDLY